MVIKMFAWYVFILFRLSVALVPEKSSTWRGHWQDEVNMVSFRTWVATALAALSISQQAAFNNAQNLPIWCGKF
jgi:hypothetical protein